MGLEDELKQAIWREVAGDPNALEALVRGESVSVSHEEMLRIVLTKVNAVEQAVYRLAREIDERF